MVKICKEPYNNTNYDTYFENFGFPLSDFQKYAIEAIVTGNHTLVTAHTGSGKTLPAEFAIKHFIGLGRKVIYTSPIKALSNQKYYEFTKKFPDISIGLFTGDIKVNPTADVLIMTTEILMNHLFQIASCKATPKEATPTEATPKEAAPKEAAPTEGHIESSILDFTIDIHRELACVIFDEVHYINDLDRGKVWEQTILMLPRQIQMVMLSATIDRPDKFATWIERRYLQDTNIGGDVAVETGELLKEVWIASTYVRVVPLTHYTYMTTTESIFKHLKDKVLQKEIRDSTNKLTVIKNSDGTFKESAVHEVQKVKKILETNHQYMKRKFVLNQLTNMLKEKEMLPAIAFVFSRKNVEICANEITTNLLPFDSKVPYTIARECEQIVRKFSNYREYLELPEYQNLVKLLERGIGIHHSGMIPVLREIVEIMISKKYIMLLFATESFAIGLDCPIKTTIFTGLTKYDGKTPRLLYSHEYTQMAGRAGRRGIDKVGHIIHCNNLYMTPNPTEYRELLCGTPQRLVSKFDISHEIIMNIMRNKDDSTVSIDTIIEFIEKSMMAEEIANSVHLQKITIGHIKENYEEKKLGVLKNSRTSRDICEKWILLEEGLSIAVNKKRKEIERNMQNIIENNRWVKEDVKRILDIKVIEQKLVIEEGHLDYLNKYIENQVLNKLAILVNMRFICPIENKYEMTLLGKMSQLSEIPSLVGGLMMQNWNRFSGFGPIELVSIFSCFCQIKVADNMRKSHLTPFIEGGEVCDFIKWLYDTYQGIEDLHEEELTFDLVDNMREWYLAEDEVTCKGVIQGLDNMISIGDFTKAVLKISKIGHEFMVVCENIGEIELLKKLKEIDEHILKYIITAQSLYV